MLDWFELESGLLESTIEIEELSNQDIAIIGISANLPLVHSLDELWQFLKNGVDFVSSFPESRKKDTDPFLEQRKAANPDVGYMDGAYLDEVDSFDYKFFRLSPKEAGLMTPNQRLLLETTWKAIEDSGYGGDQLAGSRTGVYIGFNNDALFDYKRMISELDPSLLSMAVPGNLTSVLAGRISYVFDFKGPSLCIDTACSSSLVALHQACQALRSQECDLAIAGSVKINLMPFDDIRIGIEASNWRARTFDDSSDGTGGGEGVISFVLKPLGKAIEAGDHIHSIIKGSAVNQDGSSIGITAPNVLAQEDVLVRAWHNAGIHPETLGYLEAHGTGTKLGDPIEIDAIQRAFRQYTSCRQMTAIGSIKTNLGHLDHAAGLMGVLKSILAMKHKQIPPTLHFTNPNRNINFIESPVYINEELKDWKRGAQPRRCGVSAFGMSGTNCHVVLEESPEKVAVSTTDGGKSQLLAISAKSEASLQKLVEAYAQWPIESTALSDLCFTANTGRGHYSFRLILAFQDLSELSSQLYHILELGLATNEDKGIYYGTHKLTENEANLLGYPVEGIADSLHQKAKNQSELLQEIAALYVQGARVEWSSLYRGHRYRRVSLPTYCFEKTRCWLDTENLRFSTMGLSTTERAVQADQQKVHLTGNALQDDYSATEQALASIWGDNLGINELHLEDTYYELGGDSILALKIVNRIENELKIKVEVSHLLRNTSIHSLAEWIDLEKSLHKVEAPVPSSYEVGIQPASLSEFYPLTPSQQRVYIQQQWDANQTTHNAPFCVRVEGNLSHERVEAVLITLVRRHEVFRTSFGFMDGAPVQRVIEEVDFKVAFFASEEDQVMHLIAKFINPFELSSPPLIRAGIIQISDDHHIIILDMHHIIADGVSNSIFIKEFCDLYRGHVLPPLKLQYKDYAVWLQSQLNSRAMQQREKYWEQQLLRPLPELKLPTDHARPLHKTYNGNSLHFTFQAEVVGQLQQMAKQQQVTMNSLLFTLYSLLIYKHSTQDDMIVGVLVSGRNHPALEAMVGMFINFLPIRMKLSGEDSFSMILAAAHRRILAAYENDYPFDRMVQNLALQTDHSRNPIYDTMFVYHNEFKMQKLDSLQLADLGLGFTEYPLPQQTAMLDIKLDVWENESDGLQFVLNYNTDLFSSNTMNALKADFVHIVESVLENSQICLQDITYNRLKDVFLPAQKVQVVISASFTAEPVVDYLVWWCNQFNVDVNVTFAPYHQVFQQLLDAGSLINTNNGVNVLLIRFEDWIREDSTLTHEKINKLEKIYGELTAAIRQAKKKPTSFIGIFPASLQYGPEIQSFIHRLNQRFSLELADLNLVHVLDFNSLSSLYQIEDVFDPVKDREGHIPFSDEFYAALGTSLARTMISWRRPAFKVIVLDCDNTLWQGICGEAGPLGVSVYASLQRQMLENYEKGLLLALCSKNNEADVWEVFENNPQMILKKEHFVAWKINWEHKSANIRLMAKEMNLGLDSFVFIDDSSYECQEMRANCPEVLTIQLPQDPKQLTHFLKHIWAFDSMRQTTEDHKRTDMYRAEINRKELRSNTQKTLVDFLQDLQLKMVMKELQSQDLPRAAQLTERTNQFNMSTIRRTEEDLRRLLALPDRKAWTVEVRDRFGEYGLVGVVIAQEKVETLLLDSFLLSCRVLGRQIEQAILTVLKRYCKEQQLEIIEADYRATDKNEPFRRFLTEAPWSKKTLEDGSTVYSIAVGDIPAVHDYIELVEAWTPLLTPTTEIEMDEELELQIAVSSMPSQLPDYLTNLEESEFRYEWEALKQDKNPIQHQAYLLPLQYHLGEQLLKLQVRLSGAIPNSRAEYQAPVKQQEAELALIWEALLGIPAIGLRDDFFELGGNSLQAVSLASRIFQHFQIQLSLRDLFQNPVLEDLAEKINCLINVDGINNKVIAIPNAEPMINYPVSSAQKRLLILHQMNPTGTSYNISTALRIVGSVDQRRLELAFLELIQRHESLRSTFYWTAAMPVQQIMEKVEFQLEFEKVSDENVISTVKNFVRAFELERAPLLRVRLLQLESEQFILLIDMHHLISDGLSISILGKELIDLYEGLKLPELRIQYKDYVIWLNEQQMLEQAEQKKIFWLNSFQGEVPLLNLPTNKSRTGLVQFTGDKVRMDASQSLRASLEIFAVQTQSTVYMVLLSCFSILLSKYSGQEDLVIGSPVAGRNHADLEPLIGMFVNTLALRLHPNHHKTFAHYLAEVKEYTLEAFEHQEYPFEALVDQLQLERDLTRNPLFDVFFVMQNMNMDLRHSGELSFMPYEMPLWQNRFDLTLEVIDQPNNFSFSFEYSTGLFEREAIERMAGHYIRILEVVLANPSTQLSEIDMLLEKERIWLLEKSYPLPVEFAEYWTVQEGFEAQASERPDHPAIIFGNETLTYAQLNRRANKLAHSLRKQGVAADSIVGILADRSLEMIIGILAVLKAGGAYLPIDPLYPMERKEYMLMDSQAKLLLAQPAFMHSISFDGGWFDITEDYGGDENAGNAAGCSKATDLAYVIYTSGSTGKPKGVMVEHRGILNLKVFFEQYLEISTADRIVQFASLSFDASAWEIFMALLTGATLVLVSQKDYLNYHNFETFLNENRITVATLPPNYAVHLQPDQLKFLRKLITAGSAATVELVHKWMPFVKYYNAYGPTETTVCATIWEANPVDFSSNGNLSVSIGKPITNTGIYIVDADLQLQPIGVIGEICIGGAGVARGYLHREDLTRERFVNHPFQQNARMYRTGDLGRWLEDGTIEYLGRKDEQVKIRGFRIELGEIEAALLKQKAMREAVVINRTGHSNNAYLCAYYTANEVVSTSMIRSELQQHLPSYMIPSTFVRVEEFPLTPSGKVDRKALPEPAALSEVEFIAPRTFMEQQLTQLWQSILELQAIGIGDSFFEMGGDSLKAALLVTRIQLDYQVELLLSDVFRNPTIEQMAQVIEKAAQTVIQSIPQAELAEVYPLSSGQKRLYIMQQLDDEDISYNMPGIFRLYGPLDLTRLTNAIQTIVQRHEILRTSFEMVDREFVQRVHEHVAVKIEHLQPIKDNEEETLRSFIQPFLLHQPPLLRVGLWKRSDTHHYLLFDLHHIISDGVSIQNLVLELSQLYEGKVLTPLPIQFKDYAVWQQSYMNSDRLRKQEIYWLQQLADYTQGPPLHSDYSNTDNRQDSAGKRLSRTVELGFITRLNALQQRTGTTRYMVLSAAYQILLAYYSGQSDIVIGSHVSGRSHNELNCLIGMFVNTVVLRSKPKRDKPMDAYLLEYKQTVIESFEHQDYPFELLVEKTQAAMRDPNRNPLFDALFILQHVHVDLVHLNELSLISNPFDHPSAKFDLTLEAIELSPDAMMFTLEYRTARFKASTMEMLLEGYLLILTFMAEYPDKLIQDIPLDGFIPQRSHNLLAEVDFTF